MKLRRVGFFQELKYGSASDPSIYDKMGSVPEDSDQVIQYLKTGYLLIVSPEVEHDVISPEKKMICGLNILTDGHWAWPESFSYYIQNYKVALPTSFLEYVRKQKYSHISLSEKYLMDLELLE